MCVREDIYMVCAWAFLICFFWEWLEEYCALNEYGYYSTVCLIPSMVVENSSVHSGVCWSAWFICMVVGGSWYLRPGLHHSASTRRIKKERLVILNLFLFRTLRNAPVNFKSIILKFTQIECPMKKKKLHVDVEIQHTLPNTIIRPLEELVHNKHKTCLGYEKDVSFHILDYSKSI